jgi:hypothetical protein
LKPTSRRTPLVGAVACFFLSGTVYAAAIVLAAFRAGLALGRLLLFQFVVSAAVLLVPTTLVGAQYAINTSP